MSEHIDPALTLALSALAEEDPERRRAWEHAAQCPACRALLDEGAAMLRAIDSEHGLVPVDEALKARVKAAMAKRARLRWQWEPPALALLALTSLLLAFFDGHPERPLALGVGLHCLLYELGLGMLPVAAMLLLARRGLAAFQPLRVGTLAAGFALFGQLLLRSRCPVHEAMLHLLLFHVSGVGLAALLGIGSMRWLPRLR
jgi:predicted anti-sigma-YlaC factor YlaD